MKIQRISGIQKKYLLNTVLLLALALLLSSVGVWLYVRKNMSNVVLDKYEFMTEKMGIALDRLYEKSEEVTAECITDKNVQKSLQTEELEIGEKNALSKYFAYIDLDYVTEYCYVDNKENVYTKSYSAISYKDFKKSGIEKKLSSNYAKTRWFFQEDTLFYTGKEELFIGRNVRSMEYVHDPGMLFFKMDEKYLESIVEEQKEIEDIVVGVVDDKGSLCMQYAPESFVLNEKDKEKITGLFKHKGEGMILERERLHSGMLQAYRQQESGFTIFTLVPNAVLNQGTTEIILVLLTIYLVVILIAMEISFYISKVFTKPILMLSKEMEQFEGNDFSHTVKIQTNTELDKIGNSYNEMLHNIENLLSEIKKQEKELRTSELNMLINQIKPHFLYNTLDTIYMLARINGEKTTMKMIQSLSTYLRLSLSKGKDIVTVGDELENVQSYMEILQIRNSGLFIYEIDCLVKKNERWILKLILQPLVENAIKYGFADMEEGGIIRIEVKEISGRLTFTVYNNGTPMDSAMVDRINSLSDLPIVELKKVFPDKKHGYGVVNIITRLRLKYGDEVRFYYESGLCGTKCIVQLPESGKENDEI